MASDLRSKKLSGWPNVTAKEILYHDVELEVRAYRDRRLSEGMIWLDLPALREAVKRGEARFGERDLPAPELELPFAFRAATEAVEDGAVLMFIDNCPIKNLDETLKVAEDSRVRYLRLFAQRGM